MRLVDDEQSKILMISRHSACILLANKGDGGRCDEEFCSQFQPPLRDEMAWDNDKYPGLPREVDHVLAKEDSSLDSLSEANLVR